MRSQARMPVRMPVVTLLVEKKTIYVMSKLPLIVTNPPTELVVSGFAVVIVKIWIKYFYRTMVHIYRKVSVLLAARRDRNLTFVNCLRQQLNDKRTNPEHLQDRLFPRRGEVETPLEKYAGGVTRFTRFKEEAVKLFGAKNVTVETVSTAPTGKISVQLSSPGSLTTFKLVNNLLHSSTDTGPQLLNISGEEHLRITLHTQAGAQTEAGVDPNCDRPTPFLKKRDKRVENLYEWVLKRPNAVRNRIARAEKEGCLASLGLTFDQQRILLGAARDYITMEGKVTKLGFPGLVSFHALIARHKLFLPGPHLNELEQVEVPEVLQQLNDSDVTEKYQLMVVRIQKAVSC